MICKPTTKTNMPLLSESSADQKHHQEKPSLPAPTESLEVVPGKHRPKAATEEERLARRKEDYKRYYYRNQEASKAYAKQHQVKVRLTRKATETPEQAAERRRLNREWYARNKQERLEKQRAYNEANRERFRPRQSNYVKEWRKKTLKQNPSRRIVGLLRDRLRHALKWANVRKLKSAVRLVGCDMPILVKHIESQWTEGMNWENFGAGDGKWTMDHIKPCAAFNLADESQQLVCFNYLNLRPMWWIENLAKGSDWNGRRWKHADHACPPAPAA